MLTSLAICDIVLIERLNLSFRDGLTVLTGETGAGKTILLDALGLALGARGSADLVRSGARQAQISATFELPADHPACLLLRENEMESDGEIRLRRVQGIDGRSRAFINDIPVGLALLRRLGALLVELHGQNDIRAFIDPAAHMALLDAFAGLGGARTELARAHAQARKADEAHKALAEKLDRAAREADYLRESLAELRILAPLPGEADMLARNRRMMMNAGELAGEFRDALNALDGQTSPIPELSSLMRRLERRRAQMEEALETPLEALGRALDALEEAREALESICRRLDFDPGQLDMTEERLFALRAAARKYRKDVDELPALADEMAQLLDALQDDTTQREQLRTAARSARDAFLTRAKNLSDKRRQAAPLLEQAVNGEFPALRLGAAHFAVRIDTDPDTDRETGHDRVSFEVRTNPGTPAGPLAKVASGGELSRILLALKVALADRGSAPTLIFDEIDSGVGGAVSDDIGQRLARLSASAQIVAVTHAPQIAARARQHLLIEKTGDGQTVKTTVDQLSPDCSEREIARMLAGQTVTEEARAAARRLILESR